MMTKKENKFSVRSLKAGKKIAEYLAVGLMPDGSTLSIPCLCVRGQQAGPVLAVLAGVHGDEFEGIPAIHEIFAQLDPGLIRGTFVGIPVSNPPAVLAGTRASPVDGLNLARTFPGSPGGTVSQRLAHYIAETIIAPADLMIDLHTAGARYTMPLYCGYYVHDDPPVLDKSRAAALAFSAAGAEVVVEHTLRPWVSGDLASCGSSVEEAGRRKIPCIYAESTGGGWLRPRVVSFYVAGVLNVMRYLLMLPEPPHEGISGLHLVGPRHKILVPESGLLVSRVAPLDFVAAGDCLGTVMDPLGGVVAEVRTERCGWVTMMRAHPVVYAGEMVYELAVSTAS
jgi:N2-acetyl-L-2,4-diaminobutanoate deacetylase